MLIFDPEFTEIVTSLRPTLNLSHGHYVSVGSPCPDWTKDYEKALLENPIHEPCPQSSVGDEDPHILMYTSGTTGVPKGAILSHRKTFFNALNADIFYNLTSRDIMLVSRPMFHSGGAPRRSGPCPLQGWNPHLENGFGPMTSLRPSKNTGSRSWKCRQRYTSSSFSSVIWGSTT